MSHSTHLPTLRPGPAGLPQPYAVSDVLPLIGQSVWDGFTRALRLAPWLSAACALLYTDARWGLADGFGWAGLGYLIAFWFEVGNQKAVEVERAEHTRWLCPEIDADDVRWWRAGSLLTASATCFYLYALIRQLLNTL